MRYRSSLRYRNDFAADKAEAAVSAHLITFVEKKLKTEAYPQQGFSLFSLPPYQLGDGGQFLHCVSAGADSGQNQTVRPFNIRRPAAYHDICADILAGVGYTPYVPHSVIYDYKHNFFVRKSGTSPKAYSESGGQGN
jgi:hypothetical protein